MDPYRRNCHHRDVGVGDRVVAHRAGHCSPNTGVLLSAHDEHPGAVSPRDQHRSGTPLVHLQRPAHLRCVASQVSSTQRVARARASAAAASRYSAAPEITAAEAAAESCHVWTRRSGVPDTFDCSAAHRSAAADSGLSSMPTTTSFRGSASAAGRPMGWSLMFILDSLVHDRRRGVSRRLTGASHQASVTRQVRKTRRPGLKDPSAPVDGDCTDGLSALPC